MEENKNCKTCQYYVPHYIKYKRFLIEIGGHCKNIKKRKKKEDRGLRRVCADWAPSLNKKEERRKSIEEALQEMEKTLEDIRMILLSDQKTDERS